MSESSEKLLFNLSALARLSWAPHCIVFGGVLGFLGWTALRQRHRRFGGTLLAGLPSIHLKPGLFRKLKAKKNIFRGNHQSRHRKLPPMPLITTKLEPSHELLTADPTDIVYSRMIPDFLPSPPAAKLAVRGVRRRVTF